MTNCIFYSIIFTLFINFTFQTLRFSQVNRVYMSLNKGLFEASTITVNKLGEPITPYYDKEVLEKYVHDYFKENLKNFVTEYDVEIYYFNRDKGTVCYLSECRDVNITLNAKINSFYTYKKSQNFSVFERGE